MKLTKDASSLPKFPVCDFNMASSDGPPNSKRTPGQAELSMEDTYVKKTELSGFLDAWKEEIAKDVTLTEATSIIKDLISKSGS